jgi:hypothetical protein
MHFRKIWKKTCFLQYGRTPKNDFGTNYAKAYFGNQKQFNHIKNKRRKFFWKEIQKEGLYER